MTSHPRAFFAIDAGMATTTAALIAHVAGRWRLVAHAAAPAGVPTDALLGELVERVRVSDAGLVHDMFDGAGDPRSLVENLTRLEAQSSPRRRIAVLAAASRQRRRLEGIARRAGWEVVSGTADEDDPLQLTSLVLAPTTDALLVGADDPPESDERRLLTQVAAVAAAGAGRRPDLQVILAGGARAHADEFGLGAGRGHAMDGDSTRDAGADGGGELAVESDSGHVPAAESEPSGQPRILLAPPPTAGQPAGSDLQYLLESLRALPNDSRLAMTRATASLAYVLDRSIELVEVGLDGALRCRAEPLPGDRHRTIGMQYAVLEGAGFAPPDPPDDLLDGILAWSSIGIDRYRLGDRIRDLRLSPWGDADGDALALRLAAGRAGLDRLVGATEDITERPAPDLLVGGGGVWAAVPPPVVALALADLVRRPGASQLALDHARLLAPLGTIENQDERAEVLRDLADDLLLPLGSMIVPAGLRAGRTAGTLRVVNGERVAEIELEPGGIELIDLPPGQAAAADLDFHDTVHLGARGRHFATEVTGGLGGLLVDLRDVPLRLPDRGEERRNLLAEWQRAMWPEVD